MIHTEASPPPLPSLTGVAASPVPSTQSYDDDVLQNHYARMQRTLLSAVDKQMMEVETRLGENQAALKKTEVEKRETGVALYKAQKELGKLNDAVGKLKTVTHQREDEKKLLESEREALEREISRLVNANRTLQFELDQTRGNLIDSTTKTNQLGEVNAVYHSDIKVQRRMCSKLKKELEISEGRRKMAEADLEEMRKQKEEVLQAKKELELVLRAQRGETGTAQISINKMHREILDLSSAKKGVEKQWEEAIAAMAKRDQTFQAVETNRETLKSKLLEAENLVRVLKLEKEEGESRLKEKEIECEGLHATVSALRTTVSTWEGKGRETRNALVEAQIAESLYRQELDTVNKHHQLAVDELNRKTSRISDLSTKIESLKSDFDLKMRNDLITQVARKEEQANAAASNQVRTIVKEQEGKTINLRHENAELHMTLNAQQEQLRDISHDRDVFKSRYEEINSHYVRLYDEAKHLIYALERKEHDVNYLKSKIQERDHGDKTRPLQLALLKLQKDLEASKLENDRLQNMWLQSQKDSLKAKESSGKLNDSNSFLKTQLHITDTIAAKTATEISDAKKEAIEHKLEAAKLWNELRKLQPVVEELREKNTVLEQQLSEARLQLQESNVNGETATHMLKHEIRRLYNDRTHTTRARISDERATHAMERKYILAREMVDKLKASVVGLQRENFELRKEVERGKRECAEWRGVVRR
ncbi:Coiled-coil domain-containing protein 40, partial [Borealophlyctis nickersoniae]